MRQGRFDEAEARFRAPQLRSFLTSARFKAFSLAMLLRLEQLRSGKNLPSADVELLRSLFTKGRSLGSQDGIVEALWCAHMLDGETALATQLLEDYLCVHRRERSLPEWSLRDTTAADSAWQAYHARSGACAVSVKRDVA